ncbi:unnamed protein product [Spirodela intermedia]|uniref:Uncharacterized protein n=2 Tax=Spirodela intermedia TaxID=51605 RepID=A0A7I8K9I2_SPIIN|nr:unnamed protein product [Spirodela intermedia]CAA6658196.1 unnamed protein product [Spirodela intermedia]CAA7394371.1 unnamed protein product [Spirodela intermedia]
MKKKSTTSLKKTNPRHLMKQQRVNILTKSLGRIKFTHF